MKREYKRISTFLILIVIILSQLLGSVSWASANDNYILEDAFVSNFNGQADSSMVNDKKDKLIIGKQRHAYIKFDLSSLTINDVDKIVLNISKSHGANTLLFNEASDYLRENKTEEESDILWTKDNITYNTRPLDREGATKFRLELPEGEANLQVDLTELVVDVLNRGEKTVTVHFTTNNVSDANYSASEFYSTRSLSKIPFITVINKNAETPIEPKGENSGSYLQNASKAIKIFKMKNFEGDNESYVKVQQDGTLKANVKESEASTFALYVYEYDGEKSSEGATKTTYAIKSLDNNKYLSIQNYFKESDSEKNYYNKIDSNTFEIQAEADEVNWNERFYIEYYKQGGYYTIYSHLDALRDDPSFYKEYVRANETNMTSSKINKRPSKFQFIEVKNDDQLEVSQSVTGTTTILSWKAINDDRSIKNYSINGIDKKVKLKEKDGYFTAQIKKLKDGEDLETTVSYSNGQELKQEKVNVRVFKHPGLLHSEEELDKMKESIENIAEPWYSDFLKLQNTVPNNLASYQFIPTVHSGVGRGTPDGSGNISDFEQSANAAYFNALQWVIKGEDKYAETSMKILNEWAENLKVVDGRDRILGAAINSYKFANAAEIIRYHNGGYKGYTQTDFIKLQDMMKNVIYPVIQDLGSPMIANGNWDTAALNSMIAIGVLCDDPEIFNRAVRLYQDIHVNGSIAVYLSDTGQSVESARDQAHAQLGIGYMAEICEIAMKQGIDLYSLYNNRLAKGFEWAAKYNLYHDVSFTPLMNVFGDTKRGFWDHLDSEKINRGELRPVYELPLAHYKDITGVDMSWTAKAAEAMRAQGYVHNDNLNFGTLTTYNGKSTDASEPYFLIRTRLEPWYERTLIKIGDEYLAETLTSYFSPNENGILTANKQRASAPYFQLVNNKDGTYSIKSVVNNRYLSIKDEKSGDFYVIKADASEIGKNEKFRVYSTGTGFHYLQSPAFDNRIVYVNQIGDKSNPENAELTLVLGNSKNDDAAAITNYEKLIFVYNTSEESLQPR